MPWRKVKQRKGIRKCQSGVGDVIYNRVVREILIEKATFDKDFEGSTGVNHGVVEEEPSRRREQPVEMA